LTFQVLGELPTKASRKQHRAIFTAFPLGDANLARLQIDIGGTQLNEFSIAHAREEQGCGSFKTTPPRLFNQSEMGSCVLASRVWSLPGHFPVGIVRRVVALLFLLQMDTPVRLKIAADPQRPQA
jgi:hypothetical protein